MVQLEYKLNKTHLPIHTYLFGAHSLYELCIKYNSLIFRVHCQPVQTYKYYTVAKTRLAGKVNVSMGNGCESILLLARTLDPSVSLHSFICWPGIPALFDTYKAA